MDDGFEDFDPVDMFLYEAAHRDNHPSSRKLQRELLGSNNIQKINDQYSIQFFGSYLEGLQFARKNPNVLISSRDILKFQVDMNCKYRDIICTGQSVLYQPGAGSNFKVVTETKNPFINRLLGAKEISLDNYIESDPDCKEYSFGYHDDSTQIYKLIEADGQKVYELDSENLNLDTRLKIPSFLSNPLFRAIFENDFDLMKKYYNKMDSRKGLKVRIDSLGFQPTTPVWTPIYLTFTQNGLIFSAASPLYDFRSSFIIKN